jgi:hypothetical protein
MLKTTRHLILTAIALTAVPAAAGTDVSYDFLEARFVDAESGNLDGDGIQIAGSYNVQGNWLLVGGLTFLDLGNNVDTTTLQIGGGYVWPQAENFDLYAIGSVLRVSVDTNFGDADENGFGITGGIRSRFTPQLEGRAEINYVDVNDADTFIRLSGDYYFNSQVAAGLSLDLGGDADAFSVGVRWFFGQRRVK